MFVEVQSLILIFQQIDRVVTRALCRWIISSLNEHHLCLNSIYNCHVLTLVPLVWLCFSMVRAGVGVGSLCSFFYN